MNIDAYIYEIRSALLALRQSVEEIITALSEQVDTLIMQIASQLMFDPAHLASQIWVGFCISIIIYMNYHSGERSYLILLATFDRPDNTQDRTNSTILNIYCIALKDFSL